MSRSDLNLTYEAPSPWRFIRYFTGISVKLDGETLWWSETLGLWAPLGTPGMGRFGNKKRVRRLKSALRYIRKRPELRGATVTIHNRFQNFNVVVALPHEMGAGS